MGKSDYFEVVDTATPIFNAENVAPIRNPLAFRDCGKASAQDVLGKL